MGRLGEAATLNRASTPYLGRAQLLRGIAPCLSPEFYRGL